MHNTKPNSKIILDNTMTTTHMNNNDSMGSVGRQFSNIDVSTFVYFSANQQGLGS
jgi:hypothetical protein